jgi:predicted ATPase
VNEVAEHADQVIHRYSDPQDRTLITLYTMDLKLVALVHGSQARWIAGEDHDAEALCLEQERFAASLNHPHSLAWTHAWGAMSYLFRGDVDGLLNRLERGLSLAEQHGFTYVTSVGVIARGWAWAQQDGRLQEGIDEMQRGLALFNQTGAGIVVPFFQALLAQALGRAGRRSEALALLDASQALTEQGGERWHEAELHRIRGEVLASGPQPDWTGAEASIRQALKVATAQGARNWARRAQADLDQLSLRR